jgi:nucleoside-diphosphate-sugar epimerase
LGILVVFVGLKRRILPSNQSPLGALPARFRRERVLIIGCGDVGLRVAAQTSARVQLVALTSSPERRDALRAAGVQPLVGNLDAPTTVRRLAGLATRVLHLAPPPLQGDSDPRTRALLRALSARRAPQALVYASTSGVYGDCQGQWVDESRPVTPQSPRAQRRVDAERQVAFYGRRRGVRASVLRVPGIYAPDREGGTPRERIARGSPILRAEEDVYTNHIHANDLARACLLALWRGRARRTYNVCDDSVMSMGDYYTAAAALYGLPPPPRVSREEAQAQLSPMQWSFMRESRRLRNQRMKRELRVVLRYPHVLDGLRSA